MNTQTTETVQCSKRTPKREIILAGNGGAPEECWLWEYTKTQGGYGRVRVGGRSVLTHRLSYETHVGPIPSGMSIDHACSTPSCWNYRHLRVVTHAQNMQHRQMQTNNTSGYRGVYFDKQRNKWRAEVRHLGRKLRVGRYSTAAKRHELGFLQ